MTDAIFTLISKASNLKSLRPHLKYWPQWCIIEDLASSIEARPTRLQFSTAQCIRFNQAGLAFCKALASKVEFLQLTRSGHKARDGFSSTYLYTTVMQSAASTLRHLEIEIGRTQLDGSAFAHSRLDRLESLMVRFLPEHEDLESDTPVVLGGARCQMPLLRMLNIPASFLPLIQATAVVEASLTIEGQNESRLVIRSLTEWADLSNLVLYMEPEGDSVFEDTDDDSRHWPVQPQKALPEIVKHLTPQAQGDGSAACPSLTSVSILDQYPAWWSQAQSKGGQLDVEQMPRQQWNWREPVNDPHEQCAFVLGHSLANFVVRRMLAFQRNKCQALRGIRTIGFRIKRAARKPLRQAQFGFTFTYLAVPQVQEGPDGRPKHGDSDCDAKSQDEDWIEEVEAKKKGKQKAVE